MYCEELSTYVKYVLIFITGFLIRFLPDIIAWPWLTGWDTSEYVAVLRDYIISPTFHTYTKWYDSYVFLPPILYLVLYPFSLVIDPWWLFKLVPSILHGLQGIAFFYMLEKGFKLDLKKCYLASLIYLFYPMSLRISWGLLRNSLGNALLFFTIGRLESIKTWRDKWLFILAIIAGLSHQTTAGLLAIIFLIYLILYLIRKKLKDALGYILLFVIESIFLIIYFNFRIIWRNPVFGYVIAGIGSHKVTSLPFIGNFMRFISPFIFSQWLLLILALFGYFKNRSLSILFWTLMFFCILPGIYPGINIISWWRWILLITIPLSVYAGNALSKISLKRALCFIVIIILIGLHYATNTGLSLIPLIFPYTVPNFYSTMVRSSVPIQDEESILKIAKYIKDNELYEKYKILTSLNIYPYLHIEIRFGKNIIVTYNLLKHLTYLYTKNIKIIYYVGYKEEFPTYIDIEGKKVSISIHIVKKLDNIYLYRIELEAKSSINKTN